MSQKYTACHRQVRVKMCGKSAHLNTVMYSGDIPRGLKCHVYLELLMCSWVCTFSGGGGRTRKRGRQIEIVFTTEINDRSLLGTESGLFPTTSFFKRL